MSRVTTFSGPNEVSNAETPLGGSGSSSNNSPFNHHMQQNNRHHNNKKLKKLEKIYSIVAKETQTFFAPPPLPTKNEVPALQKTERERVCAHELDVALNNRVKNFNDGISDLKVREVISKYKDLDYFVMEKISNFIVNNHKIKNNKFIKNKLLDLLPPAQKQSLEQKLHREKRTSKRNVQDTSQAAASGTPLVNIVNIPNANATSMKYAVAGSQRLCNYNADNNAIEIYDTTTSTSKPTLLNTFLLISPISSISGNDKYIAVTYLSGIVEFRDTNTGQPLSSYQSQGAVQAAQAGDNNTAYISMADQQGSVQPVDTSNLQALNQKVTLTSDLAQSVKISGNNTIAAVGSAGILITDNNSGVKQTIPTTGYAYDIDVDLTSTSIDVAVGNAGVQIITGSSPGNFTTSATVSTGGTVVKIASFGNNFTAAAASTAGFKIIDKTTSSVIKTIPPLTVGKALGIAYMNNKLYGIDDKQKLSIIDVNTPANANITNTFDLPDVPSAIAALPGGYLGITTTTTGQFLIIDPNGTPSNFIVGKLDGIGKNAKSIRVTGNKARISRGEAGVVEVDISNILNPVFTGAVQTAGQAYDAAVSPDGQSLTIADFNKGLVQTSTQSFQSKNFNSFTAGAPVSMLRVDPVSGKAMVISGNNILQIFNIANSPQYPVASFNLQSIAPVGNTQLAAAGTGNILRVLNAPQNTAQSTSVASSVSTNSTVMGCDVSGQYAHTIGFPGVLFTLDLGSNQVVSNITLPNSANVVITAQNKVWVMGNSAVYLYDNPANPVYNNTISVPAAGNINSVISNNNQLYFTSDYGCHLIDPVSGTLLGSLNIPGGAAGAAFSANYPGYAFVAGKTAGLIVVDISNPSSLRQIATLPMSGTLTGIAIPQNSKLAVIPTNTAGVLAVDISNLQKPGVTGGLGTSAALSSAVAVNSMVYTAGTFQAFDVTQFPQIQGQQLSSPIIDAAISSQYIYLLSNSSLDVYDVNTGKPVGSWKTPFPMKNIHIYNNNTVMAGYSNSIAKGTVLVNASNTAVTPVLNIQCNGTIEDFAIYRGKLYLPEDSQCQKTTPDPGQYIIVPQIINGVLNITVIDINTGNATNAFDHLSINIDTTGSIGGHLANFSTGIALDNFTIGDTHKGQVVVVGAEDGQPLNISLSFNPGNGVNVPLDPLLSTFGNKNAAFNIPLIAGLSALGITLFAAGTAAVLCGVESISKKVFPFRRRPMADFTLANTNRDTNKTDNDNNHSLRP